MCDADAATFAEGLGEYDLDAAALGALDCRAYMSEFNFFRTGEYTKHAATHLRKLQHCRRLHP